MAKLTLDDFSPAKEAWSRPDIPLHAQAFLKFSENMESPLEKLEELKQDGSKLVFVGDIVGTGSSRKICCKLYALAYGSRHSMRSS